MHIHLNSYWIIYQCSWNQTDWSNYLSLNWTIHLLKFELLSQVFCVFWHDLKNSRHRERMSTISILCRSKQNYKSNRTLFHTESQYYQWYTVHVFWTWRSTYQCHKPPLPSGTPQNPGLLCTHWSNTEKSKVHMYQKCHQIYTGLQEPARWYVL